MSTDPNLDELMDARLHSAGQRWRDAHTAVAATAPLSDGGSDLLDLQPDPSGDRRQSHRAYWLAAASAAAVIAVVAGVLLSVGLGNSSKNPLGVGGTTVSVPPTPNPGVGPVSIPLVGTAWQLVREHGTTPIEGSDLAANLLQFTGGRVRVTQSCRTVSAPAHINGNVIVMGELHANTTAVCASHAAEFVLLVLDARPTWKISGNQLTLTKSGIGSAVFRGFQVSNPAALNGSWHLSTFRYQGRTERIGQTGKLTIHDGRLQATGLSCNTLTAIVTTYHDQLTLSDVRSTTLPCPGPPNQAAANQEQALYSVLTGSVHWSVSNGHLSIVKNSRNALSYRR